MSLESLNEKEREFWDASQALVRHYSGVKALTSSPWERADAAFASLKPQPLVWRHDRVRMWRSDGVKFDRAPHSEAMTMGEYDRLCDLWNRYEREKVER